MVDTTLTLDLLTVGTMHIRPVHAEHDIPTLHAFIRDNPLGMFTTTIPHPKHDTVQISHIPFILDSPLPSVLTPTEDTPIPLETLRSHMTRANPQAQALIDTLRQAETQACAEDVLTLFNALVHRYVPPRFYVDTKPSTGKVVPTWNYAAVQVYRKLKVYHAKSEETSTFLQRQLTDLVNLMEPKHGGEWKITDAPEKYIEMRKPGIIGLEIESGGKVQAESREDRGGLGRGGAWFQGAGYRASGVHEGDG